MKPITLTEREYELIQRAIEKRHIVLLEMKAIQDKIGFSHKATMDEYFELCELYAKLETAKNTNE